MAGVGNRAGEPLIQVMLGFLAEYLAIAVTAVVAYVFAMGGQFTGAENVSPAEGTTTHVLFKAVNGSLKKEALLKVAESME